MSTFNGIGTQFVGECCQEEDGSYIATYWFTPFSTLSKLRYGN